MSVSPTLGNIHLLHPFCFRVPSAAGATSGAPPFPMLGVSHGDTGATWGVPLGLGCDVGAT